MVLELPKNYIFYLFIIWLHQVESSYEKVTKREFDKST